MRINIDDHFFAFPYTTAETQKIGRIVARKVYEKKIFKPEGTDIANTIMAFNLHNAVNKVKSNKGGIVIIVEGEFDALARFHSLKVNDPGDMGFLIGIFEDISKETGASILILAHTNKADLDGKDKVAGAAQITDNARFVMTLKSHKGSNDVKILEFHKASYSKPTEPLFLKWQPADPDSKDSVELFDLTVPNDFNEVQKKGNKKGRPRQSKKNSFQYKDKEDEDEDFD